MCPSRRILLSLAAMVSPAVAGTVVITSLPDSRYPLSPLSSLSGIPLAVGAQVRVGAFPGMTDEQIRDAAATGGFAQVSASFVGFGGAKTIGDGVDGAAGNFEIAVRQAAAGSGSPWAGEEIALLIRKDAGQEFLVARFKGKKFEADSDTGVESQLSLHLGEAGVIIGNRFGGRMLSTSPAPDAGSYATWITGFPGLTTAAKRLAEADPDGDGRSNFLEYATGGNPAVSDRSPCQLYQEGADVFWVRFPRPNGTGGEQAIEWSPDLISAWQTLGGTPEPEPDSPDGTPWLRMRVSGTLSAKGFFRLKVAD